MQQSHLLDLCIECSSLYLYVQHKDYHALVHVHTSNITFECTLHAVTTTTPGMVLGNTTVGLTPLLQTSTGC